MSSELVGPGVVDGKPPSEENQAMRLRFSILGALVAALCMSLIGVAGASAHKFIDKGATLPATLSASGGTQTFVTKGGTTICKTVKGTGTIVALEAETQDATAEYAECEADKISGAKVEGAEYEFNANETVTILKVITVTAPLCKVTVHKGEGTINTKLSNVKYSSSGGVITEVAKVSGITSKGEGVCAYSEESNGTYEGETKDTSSSGTLEWV
jgi:hypothetical protein